jgi:AcrR family transcriptional regulator
VGKADEEQEKQQLSRERIVAAALALVDAEGLDALTMRRLGRDLGVDPMAVYYYVEDKDALLDALVEAVMAQIDLSCDLPGDDPEDRLAMTAQVYAEALLAHPHALPIVLARSPRTPAALKPVEFMLSEFMRAGLSADRAVVAMNTLAAAVRGYVGMTGSDWSDDDSLDVDALRATMSPEEFPALAEASAFVPEDPTQMFDQGVRAIVRGFLGTEGGQADHGTAARPHHMEGS